MTPTMEEVAGWLREASFHVVDLAHDFNLEQALSVQADFNDRAAQVEAMGWRPIEEAPKDGTWILAVNAKTNHGRQHVVHHSERHSGKFPWVTDSAPMSFVDGLTHWMPLPQPPVKK